MAADAHVIPGVGLIPLDEAHGVDLPCAASFDSLPPMRKFLTNRIGSLMFPRREIVELSQPWQTADP